MKQVFMSKFEHKLLQALMDVDEIYRKPVGKHKKVDTWLLSSNSKIKTRSQDDKSKT